VAIATAPQDGTNFAALLGLADSALARDAEDGPTPVAASFPRAA